MQTINFAKRAKKLVPDLSSFKVEQSFKTNSQGYLVSNITMWIHTNNTCWYGLGDTKIEAWEALVEEIQNANR